jgi:hypothetical protein
MIAIFHGNWARDALPAPDQTRALLILYKNLKNGLQNHLAQHAG